MTLMRELTLITVLGLILYIIDVKTSPHLYRKCQTPEAQFVLFFHHIINAFVYVGWLANSKILLSIYLMIPLILFIQWEMNKNKCVITQYTNDVCQLPDNYRMNDIFGWIGLKDDIPVKIFFATTWMIVLLKVMS